jgi:hypothetical protein
MDLTALNNAVAACGAANDTLIADQGAKAATASALAAAQQADTAAGQKVTADQAALQSAVATLEGLIATDFPSTTNPAGPSPAPAPAVQGHARAMLERAKKLL